MAYIEKWIVSKLAIGKNTLYG